MTVRSLYKALEALYSPQRFESWDHDGLTLCADGEREVRKVLCVLDITDSTVKYAKDGGFDVILAHHPMIFRPTDAILDTDAVGRRVLACLASGISVMTFHTRADVAEGGVGDALLHALGLTPTDVECDVPYLRFGTLPAPMAPTDFAAHVADRLSAPALRFVDGGKPVSTVAVCGGSGKEFAAAALAHGADAYVTGELGHHALTDLYDLGLTAVEAGHYETEYPVLTRFEAALKEIVPDAQVEILNHTPIQSVKPPINT